MSRRSGGGGFGGGRSRSSSLFRDGTSHSPSPRFDSRFSPRYSRPYTGGFYRPNRGPFRVWPHYYRGYGFPNYYGSRYPYFPFILDLYRSWYRPIITPIIINVPQNVPVTNIEQQIRDDLIQGSTVGEVSLAFGDLSQIVSLNSQEEINSAIAREVGKINEIIQETNFWTSFQEGGQTFIVITNAADNEQEFLAKMRTTIEGNPTFYLNQHERNVSNAALLDFVASNQVPPENILYYSPK